MTTTMILRHLGIEKWIIGNLYPKDLPWKSKRNKISEANIEFIINIPNTIIQIRPKIMKLVCLYQRMIPK
jgi:hypothetical protein